MPSKFFRVVILIMVAIFAITVAPAVSAQDGSDDPAPGAPGVWTPRVCAGEDAIVVQNPDESGAGVTLSLVDAWGCEGLPEFGLLFIEPWRAEATNADAACLAETWEDALAYAETSGNWNGSLWVLRDDLADHKLVVSCDQVEDDEELGLNPFEHQVAWDRTDWVFFRASQLAGSPAERSAYCMSSQDLLAGYLCGTWFQNYPELWGFFMGP